MEKGILYNIILNGMCAIGFAYILFKVSKNNIFKDGKGKDFSTKTKLIWLTIIRMFCFAGSCVLGVTTYHSFQDYMDLKDNSLQSIQKIVRINDVSNPGYHSLGSVCYESVRDKSDKDCLDYFNVDKGNIVKIWISKRTGLVLQYAVLKKDD